MSLPEDLKAAGTEVVRRLRAAGHEAWWVGGCVRDLLLGREAKDLDVATSARPEQVEALFPGAHGFGRSFLVVQVRLGGREIEVATFRRDVGSRDGRHPNRVEPGTAEDDARRRDFTVNALFYDPLTGTVQDLVGGEADLRRRVIRAIGTPADRFREDYLRLLRAVRFASVLEFGLDPDTEAAIRAEAEGLRAISAERIRDEFSRILTESPRAGQGLRRLLETGLLEIFLPEVAAMDGCEQPPQFHPEGDVFTHTALMLDELTSPSLPLALSVVLHDVGKPLTYEEAVEPDGSMRIRFSGHAEVGARMAEAILRRLRYPNRVIDEVAHVVAGHMRFMDVPNMRKATLRRLVADPTFETQMELHRVDCLSCHGDLSNYGRLREVQAEIAAEPVLPARWITGHDVLAAGVRPGPEVGRWLEAAYTRQLDGTDPGREAQLAWLKEAAGGAGATQHG